VISSPAPQLPEPSTRSTPRAQKEGEGGRGDTSSRSNLNSVQNRCVGCGVIQDVAFAATCRLIPLFFTRAQSALRGVFRHADAQRPGASCAGERGCRHTSLTRHSNVTRTSLARVLQEIATLALELQSMFVTSPLCIEKL
jgi:hypothetical protein